MHVGYLDAAAAWPPDHDAQDAGRTVHIAVVHVRDEICFIAAAPTPEALTQRLAEYVRENARIQLWPEDARRVERLLAAGRAADAGAHYFRSVGERWDRERLVVETVALEQHAPRPTVPRGSVGDPDQRVEPASGGWADP